MSAAHRLRAWSVLRRQRAWIAIALLVGIVGGGLIAAAAGAHRTATVHDRFLDATDAGDVFVVGSCVEVAECGDRPVRDVIAALPGVQAATVFASANVPVTDIDGAILNPRDDSCASGSGELVVVASDGSSADINRVHVIEGDLPDPTEVSSVLVSRPFADRASLTVGDQFLVYLDAQDCYDSEVWGDPTPVRVDGIGLMSGEVVPEQGYYFEGIHLSAAASTRLLESGSSGEGIRELNDGDGAPAKIVVVALAPGTSSQVFEGEATSAGLTLETVLDRETLDAGVDARYRVDVTMLELVAGIGFLGAVFVLGTSLARQAGEMARDSEALVRLGWTRRDLLLVGLLQGAAVAVFASGVGAGTAIALSSRTPFGDARLLEPHTGTRLDLVFLLPGLAVLTLLVAGSFVTGTWLTLRHRTSRTRLPSTRERSGLAVAALPVTASTAWRMATQSTRSTRGVPLWSSVAGIVVGLVGIVGSLTFARGIDHLLSTDRLVGWNWDTVAFVDEPDEGEGPSFEEVRTSLLADPDVDGVGSVAFLFWYVELAGPGGDPVVAMSFDARETDGPTIVDGRAPLTPEEIAVSQAILDRYGGAIGETVELTSQSLDRTTLQATYEIVGTTVLPLDDGNSTSAVALTHDGGARLVPASVEFGPNALLVDLGPGATWSEVQERAGLPLSQDDLERPDLTSLIGLNVERARRSPVALVAILGVMVVGVVAHLVVTTVGRRRRDLAILRAIGYTKRQTLATLAWLVTLLAATTMVIAVPAGYVVGRSIWLRYAASLYIVPEARFPWWPLLVLVPCVLAFTNAVALVAGRRAFKDTSAEHLNRE